MAQRFRDSFKASEENNDIHAALKLFLSSKKIVKWKFHEKDSEESYVETTKTVFRIEKTGIELISLSEYEAN